MIKDNKKIIGIQKNSVNYSGLILNNEKCELDAWFRPRFYADAYTIGNIVYVNNRANSVSIPIGVIAVDNTITKDNSIRVIALRNMDPSNPVTGTLNSELRIGCGFGMDSSRFVFTGPYSTSSSYTSFNEGVDTFIDGWHDHKVLIDATDYYNNVQNWRTASTLPNRFGTAGGNDGFRGYSQAAMSAWRYNPAVDYISTEGYWYLPSLHELIITYQHKSTINNTFANITTNYGSTYSIGRIPYPVDNDKDGYWASTQSHTDRSQYGGQSAKFDIYRGVNKTGSYSSAQDGTIAIAYIKFNVIDNKIQLDENYHIS